MRVIHVVTIGGFVVAAACGGSSGSTGTISGGDGGGTPPGSPAPVTIQDFSFSPANVTIKVGTTVKWTNNGPSAHDVVSDAGVWTSGTLSGPGGSYGGGSTAGGSFQFTFAQPGTYPYHCAIHPPSAYPNFTGTVTVTQ
jgi:plastocyanin